MRLFQQLEVTNVELRAAGNRNPADMCEYLKIRLQALLETGYRGISATLGERILQKTRELGQRFDTHDCGLVMCHNDYSIGNIVTDGQGLTPIDFQMTAPGFSLLDVAYFLHRLEMARIYRPWLMRPWRQWRQAFIAGYGRLDLLSSPLYKALLLRLYVIRLLTYAKQQPSSMKQRVHRKWVLAIVRSRLLRELNS